MPTYLLVIITILVVVVILLLISASRQPDTFRVERSILIAASSSVPFAHVNDFHNWQAWSPFVEFDPNMTTTYAGSPEGVGANMAWSGNAKAGQGSMTIIESQPAQLIRIKLEFTKPFAATNTAEFTFQPEGDQTLVTWAMTGRNNFMFKALHSVMNMDKMVGGDFARGLAKMKALVEAKSI